MSDPFDDPEVRALMAEHGVVHKPGLAKQTLQELAPLLADEGIDLDNLDASDLDAFDAALARATERHNLELFTPVGIQHARALEVLRQVAERLAIGDTHGAQAVLATIGREPDDEHPAVPAVIGVGLGLLDRWHTDAARRASLAATRVPSWQKAARAAGVDILALARKGRAFDSLGGLHRRHTGSAIFEATALVVAASLSAIATHESAAFPDVAGELLSTGGPTESGGSPRQEAEAVRTSRPTAPVSPTPRLPLPKGAAGAGMRRNRSGSPATRTLSAKDRGVLRDFGLWLDDQLEIAAPSTDAELEVFCVLLALSRRETLSLHRSGDLDDVIDLVFEAWDAETPDGEAAIVNVLSMLDDYVHFRLDIAEDHEGWAEAHESVQDALDEFSSTDASIAAAIADVFEAADAIEPEVRRAALAATPIVAAVPALLEWIGPRRAVSASGNLRRADIERVAAMVGVTAVGVSTRPAGDTDAQPIVNLDAPLPVPDVYYALSMNEVPVLAAWWEALRIAEVISTRGATVRPGPEAAAWQSGTRLSVDSAEALLGCFVAEILTQDLSRGWGVFEDAVVNLAIARLLRALTPELDADIVGMPLESMLTPRALQKLSYLEHAGLVVATDHGEYVVPVALRPAVARGILLAMSIIAVE